MRYRIVIIKRFRIISLKYFHTKGKPSVAKATDVKKPAWRGHQRSGMTKSSSAKRGNQHSVGGMDFIGVLKCHLPIFALKVLGLCCLVLAQGHAYAAPAPESGSLPNGINLNSGQAVGGVMVAQTGGQSVSHRVNNLIEFLPGVSKESKSVADQKTEKKSPEGQDRTAEDVEKELTHKVWLLGMMHLSMLLIGIRVSGGPGALEEVFFQLRDIYRFFKDIIRPVRKLAPSAKKGHVPPRPFPPRLP